MSMLTLPLKNEDYAELLRVRKLCRTMVLSSDVYSIHIICNGNNIGLFDGDLCMDLPSFYPKAYQFGDLSLEQLKQEGYRNVSLVFYPYSQFKKGPESEKGIFYTTILTPYAGKETGATAVVFFNEKNLAGILGGIDFADGLTYLMDRNGKILYQMGEGSIEPMEIALTAHSDQVEELPGEIFGKDHYAMACSTTGGLQIVSVIPEKSLFMQMGNLRIFISILNITTIFMCLFLSLMLARKRSSILSKTLALMDSEETQGENVFSAIYQSVSHMVETNTNLKEELGSQKELLRTVFWNRILTVNTMSDEEISHLASSAGIPITDQAFCLLVASFATNYDMEAEDWNILLQKRQKVLEDLNKNPSLKAYAGACGMDQIVLLVPIPEEKLGDYQNYVQNQVELLEQETMLICAGSLVIEDLRDLYSAYLMCGNQINLRSSYPKKASILWCSGEELGTEATFYFTDDLKNQIVLWIKSGQQELVKEGFRRILEDNYMKRQISSDMEKLLIAKLKLTLLSAYDSRMAMNLNEVFDHIDIIQTDAWMFSYILRVALDMCGHYLAGIRSHEDGLQKKIVTYIEKHFTEYGFGLTSIAEHCNLSEAYFSQIFKEIMGENFSAYVEKKRMDHAYRLIVESDMTIDGVAENTGYSNTNAFRKAYKRFYGVTPSQTRQNRAHHNE